MHNPYLLNRVTAKPSFLGKLNTLLHRFESIDINASGFPVKWKQDTFWKKCIPLQLIKSGFLSLFAGIILRVRLKISSLRFRQLLSPLKSHNKTNCATSSAFKKSIPYLTHKYFTPFPQSILHLPHNHGTKKAHPLRGN